MNINKFQLRKNLIIVTPIILSFSAIFLLLNPIIVETNLETDQITDPQGFSKEFHCDFTTIFIIQVHFETDTNVDAYLFNTDQYIAYQRGENVNNYLVRTTSSFSGGLNFSSNFFSGNIYLVIENYNPTSFRLTVSYSISKHDFNVDLISLILFLVFISFLAVSLTIDMRFFEKTKRRKDDLFWENVHPDITKAVRKIYETGSRNKAVLSAFMEINNKVKDLVKNCVNVPKDGTSLMDCVFSSKQPILKIADVSTESGKNIQDGFARIFSGAILGIRNPNAHDNIPITEIEAKHLIMLASLLLYKIDEAEIIPKTP